MTDSRKIGTCSHRFIHHVDSLGGRTQSTDHTSDIARPVEKPMIVKMV